MKRCIIFLLALASVILTGCSWFDNPAEAERIGCGYVQNDKGLLFVEIDDAKYSPDYVYTGETGRSGKETMKPVEGMQITVFRLRDHPKAEFISGDRSEEYLNKYFKENYTLAAILALWSLFFVLVILFGEKSKPKKIEKVYAD